MLRSPVLILGIGSSLIGMAGCAGPLSPHARAVLDHGQTYQLMLIHPARTDRNSSPATFHDCVVDSAAPPLDRKGRRDLVKLLDSSLSSNGPVTGCMFFPRYGVHVIRGQHVLDMEICFDCYQCAIYLDGVRSQFLSIDPAGKRVLASLLGERSRREPE